MVDTMQTLYISDHPKYHELNPILGRHPKREKVLVYMGAMAVAHACVSCVLSPQYRKWWQYGAIVGEAAVVIHNQSIGIGVTF